MVCKLQTSLGFRYGSGRPLAGNPASSSDCLTSFSSNPLSEEVIYIYICCSARIGAPHFRNVRGRPFAKIAALTRNLSTSLLSNPLSEEVIYIYMLPGEDSNLEPRLQRPVCYHYTTGHPVLESAPYSMGCSSISSIPSVFSLSSGVVTGAVVFCSSYSIKILF